MESRAGASRARSPGHSSLLGVTVLLLAAGGWLWQISFTLWPLRWARRDEPGFCGVTALSGTREEPGSALVPVSSLAVDILGRQPGELSPWDSTRSSSHQEDGIGALWDPATQRSPERGARVQPSGSPRVHLPPSSKTLFKPQRGFRRVHDFL